ncbi:MAG: phosphotransferase [Chloroflexi bacterium]|nr:phosphotransferase [Chloroflexota bacterium]
MDRTIASAEEVEPAWLTRLLRDRRIIGGDVSVDAVRPGQGAGTFASTVWHLAVEYRGDPPAQAPRRLFLKVTSGSASPSEFAAKEHRFYTMLAPAMEGGPGAHLPIPCYDASFDATTGAAHLLLADISESHEAQSQPDERVGRLAVDALAALHAAWWDSPRLGRDIGRLPSLEERRRDVANARSATATFFDRCGDALPARWRRNYERVLDGLPGLYGRHATGRNLTLAHGDAHLGNYLFPLAGSDAGSPRAAHMLDWQFWHPTIGGTDLAFLIARWEPEVRRGLESTLLRRYHAALLGHGVTGYSWDDCFDDYRLSVILVSVFIPVWQCTLWGWAPNLPAVATVMSAYEELGCEELLGRSHV